MTLSRTKGTEAKTWFAFFPEVKINSKGVVELFVLLEQLPPRKFNEREKVN